MSKRKTLGVTGRGVASRRLRQLLAAARGKKRAFIVIYDNPDPDALASAWALQRILFRLNTNARIVYTGEVGRPENEAMISFLGIHAEHLKQRGLAHADFIALVDAQPLFFPRGILPRCDVVIDHHPRKGPMASALHDVRSTCLATSSIMVEYLRAAHCRIDKKLATAIFYGIISDTQHYNRDKTVTDISALSVVEGKSDRELLRRIICSAYSLSRLDYFAIAIIRLRHHSGVLFANLGPVPSSDVCAQIADFLIRVKEAKWALVSGIVGNRLSVVFRCDGQHGNAGRTASKAFRRFGSAGGHVTMGRAEMPASSLPDDVVLTQTEKVEKFVLERLAGAEKCFRPVLNEFTRTL